MDAEATELLRERLRAVLCWAAPLVPERLRIVEVRLPGKESMVSELLPPRLADANGLVEVVRVAAGVSAPLAALAPRALVCGGVLELLLYPCHDLLRAGVPEVGLAPDLCGYSGRIGELNRARTSSHLESVLGVEVLECLRTALRWLLPDGPELLVTLPAGRRIEIESPGEANVLTEDQELLIDLVLPVNVHAVRLFKIGKGWSSALKFFAFPQVVSAGAEATGATTFIKMGTADELDGELSVTRYMGELLGGNCPQVLGYAKHDGLAAIWTSLADLSDGCPVGFAELFDRLMAEDAGSAAQPGQTLGRVRRALDHVFSGLVARLHAAKARGLEEFSLADELGLCSGLPGGKQGTEGGLHMRTAFLLEKLWRKAPGDGRLASSVRAHVDSCLLESRAELEMLRDATRGWYRLCYVHGDLHGDNIMVDSNDNHFLIDFGKTGIGFCLEDHTYLESFILLSYLELRDDRDLHEALDLVPALAPPGGLTAASCDPEAMDAAAPRAPSSPRVLAARRAVVQLRAHLRRGLCAAAAELPAELGDGARQAGVAAAALLLRNSLFFLGARENAGSPRRRRLALALACAYARGTMTKDRDKDVQQGHTARRGEEEQQYDGCPSAAIGLLWHRSAVGSRSKEAVIPAVGIVRDGMALGSRVSEQSELAGGELLVSVEGDLLEVFSFETSWVAIQNSAAVQRQLLESALDKAHPPPSKDACHTRFEKARLGDLFCNVACGGSAAPDVGADTSKCKRSLQSDSQADSFESQSREVRDMICEGWTTLLPNLLDDAAKLRTWSRYVDGAVSKANRALVEGFTAPYSLALDSQQRLVTRSKQAYEVCVADSKWYHNPIGAIAGGARGWAHRFMSAGAKRSPPSAGQVIEEKTKQIKSFIHNATCPVVDAAIREASSFAVPDDFLDAVLLQDFKAEYLANMESFKQLIMPVCKSPDAGFVSLSTKVINLGFDLSTAAMSGIPAGSPRCRATLGDARELIMASGRASRSAALALAAATATALWLCSAAAAAFLAPAPPALSAPGPPAAWGATARQVDSASSVALQSLPDGLNRNSPQKPSFFGKPGQVGGIPMPKKPVGGVRKNGRERLSDEWVEMCYEYCRLHFTKPGKIAECKRGCYRRDTYQPVPGERYFRGRADRPDARPVAGAPGAAGRARAAAGEPAMYGKAGMLGKDGGKGWGADGWGGCGGCDFWGGGKGWGAGPACGVVRRETQEGTGPCES
ncbi:unnamed protein product [Prorocentrum cordatum]|uniref:Ternary complex associated domain-containing protein n=1 Tax=Prorocentrum cordatum TaxID=2364126 RepID=A0ABN9QET6_9DINO|nr:unnamed protein product [Polarella glacialis]